MGYNRLLAWSFVVLGGFNLLLAGWSFLLRARPSVAVFTGVVVFVIGILYLRRPYFEVTPNEVVAMAAIGPLRRSFPYSRLWIENKHLMGEHQGQSRRIPVQKWMSNQDDWVRLAAEVNRPPG